MYIQSFLIIRQKYFNLKYLKLFWINYRCKFTADEIETKQNEEISRDKNDDTNKRHITFEFMMNYNCVLSLSN